MPEAVAEELAHEQRGVISARVPRSEHRPHERARRLRPLRQSSESHGLPDRRSSHQCTAFPAALVPGTTRER